MIHIFCDSAAMIEPNYARDNQIRVFPLHIEMEGKMYRDEVEMNAAQVLDAQRQGKLLRTSQPSPGEKLEAMDAVLADPKAQIIDICMADGLSGTWHSAVSAAGMCIDPDRVKVVNSRTLAGPLKEMVMTAARLRNEGKSMEEILSALEYMMGHEQSYLAVADITHLGRSGRLSKTAAKAGALLKIIPSVVKSEDGTTLNLFKTARTMKKACRSIIDDLQARGADDTWTYFVCHAENPEAALAAKEYILEKFPEARCEVLPLCSLFCVHGGPGCISIHAVARVR